MDREIVLGGSGRDGGEISDNNKIRLTIRDFILILVMAVGWGANYVSTASKVEELKVQLAEEKAYIDKNIVPRTEHEVRDLSMNTRLSEYNARIASIEDQNRYLTSKVMDLLEGRKSER